ncbi:MAG: AI-2E family transporter [Patescibacteria group bacterium]
MQNKLSSVFIFILMGVVLWASYLIFKPFLVALFLAFVLFTLFRKTYKKVSRKMNNRKSLASLFMCSLIVLIIILPFMGTLSLAVAEANKIIRDFQGKEVKIDSSFLDKVPFLENSGILPSKINYENLVNSSQIAAGAKNAGGFVFGVIKSAYESTSNFLFMIAVMFFSLYYFFKDGDALLRKIKQLSPLSDKQEDKLLKRFEVISKATINGTLIIALIQGFLMGVTFWIVGVSAPVLLGIITVIISIIPLLGAVLVWLPVGLITLLLGNIWQAIVIFAIGAIIVSSVDNILRPKLVEGQSSLHPLLVFLATLGGIALFGPMGFIIGPVIISLALAFLEIYQEQFKEELEVCNNSK